MMSVMRILAISLMFGSLLASNAHAEARPTTGVRVQQAFAKQGIVLRVLFKVNGATRSLRADNPGQGWFVLVFVEPSTAGALRDYPSFHSTAVRNGYPQIRIRNLIITCEPIHPGPAHTARLNGFPSTVARAIATLHSA
jgi:hypothetical protein